MLLEVRLVWIVECVMSWWANCTEVETIYVDVFVVCKTKCFLIVAERTELNPEINHLNVCHPLSCCVLSLFCHRTINDLKHSKRIRFTAILQSIKAYGIFIRSSTVYIFHRCICRGQYKYEGRYRSSPFGRCPSHVAYYEHASGTGQSDDAWFSSGWYFGWASNVTYPANFAGMVLFFVRFFTFVYLKCQEFIAFIVILMKTTNFDCVQVSCPSGACWFWLASALGRFERSLLYRFRMGHEYGWGRPNSGY